MVPEILGIPSSILEAGLSLAALAVAMSGIEKRSICQCCCKVGWFSYSFQAWNFIFKGHFLWKILNSLANRGIKARCNSCHCPHVIPGPLLILTITLLFNVQAQQAESCHQFSNVYHSAALTVFARLLPGDEYYVQELMSSILFNTDFIAWVTSVFTR